jgi:hypothetical protein
MGQTNESTLKKDMFIGGESEQCTLSPIPIPAGQNEPFTLTDFATADWSSGVKTVFRVTRQFADYVQAARPASTVLFNGLVNASLITFSSTYCFLPILTSEQQPKRFSWS